MDITTEFRSYWVAADGARHPTRRDANHATRPNLQPIVNLDEVRGWIELSQKLVPGDDSRQFYAEQFLRPDCHPSERERLAPLICEELTDDIPLYHAQWRAAFIELRNRWPGVDGQPVIAYIDVVTQLGANAS